jgi:hypothetical protein
MTMPFDATPGLGAAAGAGVVMLKKGTGIFLVRIDDKV